MMNRQWFLVWWIASDSCKNDESPVILSVMNRQWFLQKQWGILRAIQSSDVARTSVEVSSKTIRIVGKSLAPILTIYAYHPETHVICREANWRIQWLFSCLPGCKRQWSVICGVSYKVEVNIGWLKSSWNNYGGEANLKWESSPSISYNDRHR